MVPKLRRDETGLLPRAPLPGLSPIGRRRRQRPPFVGAWQGTDQEAFGRAAAFALVGGVCRRAGRYSSWEHG